MSKWKMVKIKDVCEKASSNIAQKDICENDGEYPIYGASGFIKTIDFYVQEDEYIGIVKDGAGVGRVMVLPLKSSVTGTIQYIIPNEKVIVRYLANILTNLDLGKLSSGATIPHIYFKNYENIEIPLPPIEEQKRIANILDKASNLIDLRKQQLEKMDMLVKSKFIDMFGDPVTNPKGWEGKKIEDIAEVKIGPFGSLLHLEDYVENGHPLINPSHILNESITYDSKKTITDEKYKEMKPYHLQINDIVLGRRGEIGRCAIVKQNGFMCGTGSLLIRIKNNCLPIIMQKIISHPSFKEFLKDKSVGVTMDNLNAGTISNLKIFLPPIELQNQFAEFVEQVEKQKAVMQQSLEKMEMNYKALMQEYF